MWSRKSVGQMPLLNEVGPGAGVLCTLLTPKSSFHTGLQHVGDNNSEEHGENDELCDTRALTLILSSSVEFWNEGDCFSIDGKFCLQSHVMDRCFWHVNASRTASFQSTGESSGGEPVGLPV